MSDDFGSEAFDLGEAAASQSFDAELEKGASVEDAVNAGLKAGATIAGAAACAATGVGAIAAPLCGWLAGEVIGPIVSAIGDAIDWIGDLFSSSPPPPILIEPKDLEGLDPKVLAFGKRINAYYDQAERVDYILARRFVDVVQHVATAVEAFGAPPDADRIMGKLGENLPLTYYGAFGFGGDTISFSFDVPPDLRDANNGSFTYDYRLGQAPPRAGLAMWNVRKQLSSGSIAPAQAIAACQAILDDASRWSDQLNVEAARVIMLAGLGDVYRQGFTTTDPNRVARAAPEPFGGDKEKIAAAKATWALAQRGIFPEAYLRRHGIIAGVQFLRV